MTRSATSKAVARLAGVWLIFTGAGVGWAGPQQVSSKRWVDDPYADHVTNGTLLRFGSAVAAVHVDDRKYTGLGATIAIGRRVGILSVDLEYTYLGLQDPGPSSLHYGRAQQLGAVARVDVVRLGSRLVGANSMMAFYAEGALQRTMYHYYRPTFGEAPRLVPADNGRSQAAVGFGLWLDHRLEQPLGFPNRVGWQLGWRMAASPRDAPDPMISCRGCLAAPAGGMTTSKAYDAELVVTSTLDFTW